MLTAPRVMGIVLLGLLINTTKSEAHGEDATAAEARDRFARDVAILRQHFI